MDGTSAEKFLRRDSEKDYKWQRNSPTSEFFC